MSARGGALTALGLAGSFGCVTPAFSATSGHRAAAGTADVPTRLWHAARVDRDERVGRALVEEAARKSSVLWLRPASSERAMPAWHVWRDGAAYLVGGGLEQDVSFLSDGADVSVTLRSKDNGARLVTWVARVGEVEPGSAEWDAVVVDLHAKRLNPPDGERQPARWARESRVVRLTPTGELLESPGHLPTRSHAAEPPGSPATTRGPLPFVLGRRARRRS
ncbi:MAG: hypothetical protein QOE01_121 [Actinomycetota bacterium]|jgi:hypothetical protein|nr:hypothetical protein [Actinomycetota bacterium]MDQ1616061.1 hypothetical protein [Actinomycetota bacterium]